MAEWGNRDLAEYHLSVHANVEHLEAAWLDEQDEQINPMGSKGIGAIGSVCSPAAIVNAVWKRDRRRHPRTSGTPGQAARPPLTVRLLPPRPVAAPDAGS
jgi:hypothetical protein